jgi:hypothetical protein
VYLSASVLLGGDLSGQDGRSVVASHLFIKHNVGIKNNSKARQQEKHGTALEERTKYNKTQLKYCVK